MRAYKELLKPIMDRSSGMRRPWDVMMFCKAAARMSSQTINAVGLSSLCRSSRKHGAMGLVKKDQGIQAIYGPKADVIKSDILDIL